jgi:anti-sigma regulatory factor (Ser/Thr protein kinase)
VREVAAAAPPKLMNDVLLLTNELVTNAMRHAGHAAEDPIDVEISVDDRTIRVTVRDKGPGFDPARRRERTDVGGWGLVLVGTLSSRWAVETRDTGTDVWFEVDREASATET